MAHGSETSDTGKKGLGYTVVHSSIQYIYSSTSQQSSKLCRGLGDSQDWTTRCGDSSGWPAGGEAAAAPRLIRESALGQIEGQQIFCMRSCCCCSRLKRNEALKLGMSPDKSEPKP